MERSWYWKIVFVLLLMVFSVLVLLPSFSTSLPSWYSSLFEKKLNLGLDLQGGIHLVLGVEVEKALEDKADQYVMDFKETLKEKRIGVKRIGRVPASYDIEMELESAEDAKLVRKRILATYGNLTERTDLDLPENVIRVTFSEKHIGELRKNARDQANITIRNRVDELGVAMPTIAPHGENGILVQLPGLFDPERAKKLLGRTAQLEFKLVDDKSDLIKKLSQNLPQGIRAEYYTYAGPNDEPVTEVYLVATGKGSEGKNRLLNFFNNLEEIKTFLTENQVEQKLADEIASLVADGISEQERKKIMELAGQAFGAEGGEKMARFQELLKGKIPEDHEIGFGRKETELETEYRTYYLFRETALTGDFITDAAVRPDPETGRPEVALNFDRVGAVKFEKLTGAHVKERMAIVLEGEVSSAPVIQTRIGGGRARITMGTGGNYNEILTEAQDLAAVLRAGALPAPVRILEERTVGPTMGEDARRQGIWALAIGTALVVIFMAIYYGISGLIADFALMLNALFILAVMALAQATLTLPGIAGIVLTLGMAVDANVIINERIREELRLGKTPRAAVDAGYGRAFWTIFDANFTTLIAAVVLWSYGSGPVQGFAVTLFIGIFSSMFTAIFVTRLIMDFLVVKLKMQKLSV